MNNVKTEDVSKSVNKILVRQIETCDRAFGVTWNTVDDNLIFSVKLMSNYSSVTKRQILSSVASIYDPIGLCSPALMSGKRLFQEACRLNVSWDDELPDKLKNSWNKWVAVIKNLYDLTFPRSLVSLKGECTYELHTFTFVDGSETAYGSVTYLKAINFKNFTKVTLLASKSRLCSLNNNTLKTIPRIELASAKLGVELSLTLTRELDLPIENEVFNSDSVAVPRYIRSENARFKRYVDNKVCFIRNFTDCNNWHYVPSINNNADLLSRRTSVSYLDESQLWRSGPAILRDDSQFPPQNFSPAVPTDDDELRHEARVLSVDARLLDNPTEKLLSSTQDWFKLKPIY